MKGLAAGEEARPATMLREQRCADPAAWLASCHTCPVPELRNFAASLERDGAALRAALTLPSSNGPTERHVNELKLIKRSAFGRIKLDLLRHRVLDAA
jgi:transposase